MFDIGGASPENEELDEDGWVPDHGPARRWSRHVPDGLLADEMNWVPVPDDPEDGGAGEDYAAFDRMERIGAWERIIAWGHANQLREVFDVVSQTTRRYPRPEDRWPEAWQSDVWKAVIAEVSLMVRQSKSAAARCVGDAVTLVGRVPAVLRALERGRISLPVARMLGEETLQLSEAQAAAVTERVLARHLNHTRGTIRRALHRAVAEIDPDAVRRRAEQARRQRDVSLREDPDGMATLTVYLPAAEALGVFAVVDECARRTGGPDDDRAQSERRADALVDAVLDDCCRPDDACAQVHSAQVHSAQGEPGLCSAGSHLARRRCREGAAGTGPGATRGRVRVEVRLTVPLSTMLGLDERPAELAGYGPLPASMARELAADATWRRVLTDPASGAVLDVGTTRYRPPAALAEHVITRDQRCDFPGCRVPAHRCDLEHTVAFDSRAGTGPTDQDNLRTRCRGHHRIKQMPGWQVFADPDGGATWRTPTGHEYRTAPTPVAPPVTPDRAPRRRRHDTSAFPREAPF